ncbi:MAG TPA: ABC transporter substrate-binding protein [Vicinamibacterales bacterium]|nr:ABC transporter substrate-binding protein [Vicinamibacterales bacterium]
MDLRMLHHRLTVASAVAAVIGLVAFAVLRDRPASPEAPAPAARSVPVRPAGSGSVGPPRCDTTGGTLVAAIRGEPERFNPLVGAPDNTLDLLSHLLHGRLVRIDRETGELEPWLAERWTRSADGLSWTLALRRGVMFADGQPFTSADVLFTAELLYHPSANSALATAMTIGGRPLRFSAPDPHTVVVTFPAPYGPGLRLLDSLAILPRHRLAAALAAGRIRDVWTLASPHELVGLGPFVLARYEPGRRLILERNPRYWRVDAHGRRLPCLDRVVLEILGDANVEMLRLESGDLDLTWYEARPEDLARLRRLAAAGRLRLVDAGVGLDPNMLWFNLAPGAHAGDPRREWLLDTEFRRGLSHAVDRRAMVDSVFLGAGVPVGGVETPGNREWFRPGPVRFDYDLDRARERFAAAGLIDRDGDGRLEDRHGTPVRFSIITQRGHTIRERSVAFLQEQFRRVGVQVDIVGLDFGALVQRFAARRYDSIYFGLERTTTEPAANLDFWLTSGSFHVWNPSQPQPATAWERRIDELMLRLAASADPAERRRLYGEAQELLEEHVPVLTFVAPRIYLPVSTRVGGLRVSNLRPYVLWNADLLWLRRPGDTTP